VSVHVFKNGAGLGMRLYRLTWEWECDIHVDSKVVNLFSLGSMVQKGKFSAGAACLVRTLKNVDFLQVE